MTVARRACRAAAVLSLALAVSAGAGRAATLEGRMVFTAQEGGQWDLYAWDPGGGAPPRRLTRTPIDEIGPSLSPDRQSVVWTDSAGDLWSLDLAGGEPMRVNVDAERGLFLQPALGPGGALLVARREDPAHDDTDLAIRSMAGGGGNGDVLYGPAWELLVEPAELRRLPMLSAQFSPAWAPDHRRIAFTHLHARWTGNLISEIWEARVDHSYARQLTLLDAFCDQPAWSPDGRSIAFACDREGGYDLYEVDLEDRSVRRLTEGAGTDTEPAYGPGGRHLAFVSVRSGVPLLYLLDRATGSVSALTPFGDEERPCKDFDWR